MNPPGSFEVQTDTIGSVMRLAVRGELDLATAPELSGRLDGAAEHDGALVMLDLSDCEFIDSTGIAVIVRAWQQVDEAGQGRLVLCCPRPEVRRLLDITGVRSALSIFDDPDAAIAELRSHGD